jgi:GAF domain-containing protein
VTVPNRAVIPSLLHVDSILAHLTGAAASSEVCRFLRLEFRQYGWVGIYRLEGAELVLDGYDGEQPTGHLRIPLDRGLCGKAARENRTILVGDVSQEPEFLAESPETRSEIVVPIRTAGVVVGEIEIESTTLNAFDASDARFLDSVAAKLGGILAAPRSLPLL